MTGEVEHAQLAWRGSLVMLGDLQGDIARPSHIGTLPSVSRLSPQRKLTICMNDVNVRELESFNPLIDTDYGSHAFTVADYEGNHWHFGTYDPFADQESD